MACNCSPVFSPTLAIPLAVGSFAVTTGIYRLTKSVDDRLIPGTLNVGHGLPTIAQALIFIAAVKVDIATLCLLILASVVGAWFGAGFVSKLPKRSVQLGMGLALLFAAVLMYLRIENAVPKAAEGEAVLALTGWKLGVGIVGNLIFGALMTYWCWCLCAHHGHGQFAGHGHDRGLPDHDGFVCIFDAHGQLPIRAQWQLRPTRGLGVNIAGDSWRDCGIGHHSRVWSGSSAQGAKVHCSFGCALHIDYYVDGGL